MGNNKEKLTEEQEKLLLLVKNNGPICVGQWADDLKIYQELEELGYLESNRKLFDFTFSLKDAK